MKTMRFGFRVVVLMTALGFFLAVGLLSYLGQLDEQPVLGLYGAEPQDQVVTSTTYFPIAFKSFRQPYTPLCRFGVGGGQSIGAYDVNALRIGWYIDWQATQNPARPDGIIYKPMIRLRQVGNGYTIVHPVGGVTAIPAIVAANPGATWLIGNEPDRRWFQDDLESGVYAAAYGDLYALIKSLDPTARISAGGIVQPTPLRLQYLDMVLSAYESLYGEQMPVDVWNIHAFILPERSCDYYPDNCWGAEVPRGIDVPHGALYTIEDNASAEIFESHILAFREWMKARGYRERPLLITEFGVQMPYISDEGVNAFMDTTFDFLMTKTDAQLGYTADDNRLVQQWAWYSLSDQEFNGYLFDQLRNLTVFGQNFSRYTIRIPAVADLTVSKIWLDSLSPVGPSNTITATLHALVSNAGNVATDSTFVVRFVDNSGASIIPDQVLSPLAGCGDAVVVSFDYADLAPGTYGVRVLADPHNLIPESNKANNALSMTLVIPPQDSRFSTRGE